MIKHRDKVVVLVSVRGVAIAYMSCNQIPNIENRHVRPRIFIETSAHGALDHGRKYIGRRRAAQVRPPAVPLLLYGGNRTTRIAFALSLIHI